MEPRLQVTHSGKAPEAPEALEGAAGRTGPPSGGLAETGRARDRADSGGAASPAVTVVVPTRNRPELLEETLASLTEQSYSKFEVIVVDQSTDDRTRALVETAARRDARVRHLPTETVGSSAGRNLGALAGQGEIIAYTDDDCIVTPDWLAALIAAFDGQETAAVYGRLLPHESGPRTGKEVGLKTSLRRQAYSGKVPPWHIGHGGNMAVRREDLLTVGGFDPLLGAGGLLCSGEDGDIAYRLLAAGKRVIYDPGCLVFHRHWKSWPEQQRMERNYGIGAGAQFWKYMRCGDYTGGSLFLTWVWELGVRRLAAGVFKWQSRDVMYLGYCQLVYPWIGVWRSLAYAVDRGKKVYTEPGSGGRRRPATP
jgi:GT2 family glycosyltransferase